MADMLTVQQEVQNKVNEGLSTASQIEVMVDQNGVASLSGFVTSDAEEDLAVQAAKNTPGVTDVEEDLREVPGAP